MLSWYRNKWEVYVGIPQEEVKQLMQEIFEEWQVGYETSYAPPNKMYDGQHEQVILKTEQLTVVLIYVSADPISRVFSSFLSTRQHLGGITYLSIHYSRDSDAQLKTLLQQFSQRVPKDPWRITTHPRFQFAILLELMNKQKWKKFSANEKGEMDSDE
ncbi:hypothetical protein HNR44_002097 [Geomicrobium halophilum]|uniref:Uncharacterized protein n=1 Tax=Geomicrobium halophilum TaxID=549000 RepID=A0A841PMZ4_9BACL|nr:hypothetical protein [Geomicrobium halophilum]MBB6450119.1 hypothetical protein [Geomicrobium halophilum]